MATNLESMERERERQKGVLKTDAMHAGHVAREIRAGNYETDFRMFESLLAYKNPIIISNV